jgi:glycosyltransferase involved in cell wall biosynthesis
MNILVVNYEYPPIGGGGGVICKDIAEEHVSMGHKVTVVTSGFTGLKDEEFVNGVKIIRVPVLFRKKQNTASILSMLSYYPNSIKTIKKILQKEKFDIINTHFAIPSGPAGNYISKKYNIPNVLSIHGGDIFDPSKSLSPHKTFGLKQTVKKMLSSADMVVAQSTDTRNNALSFYGLKRNIEIIPLGIKPFTKYDVTKKEMGIEENQFLFSTIGRLVRRKNVEDLLNIFKKVIAYYPSQLVIMGDGPEKEKINSKIIELDIQNNVRLLGRVSEEDKLKYLSISDLYLSTAIHEGFGIVFLEAMDFGVPVVCYDRGGQVDFLKDNLTGRLIKLNDSNSFRDAVLELLKNKENLDLIKKHNKSYIKKFYINNIAQEYINIYKKCI